MRVTLDTYRKKWNVSDLIVWDDRGSTDKKDFHCG